MGTAYHPKVVSDLDRNAKPGKKRDKRKVVSVSLDVPLCRLGSMDDGNLSSFHAQARRPTERPAGKERQYLPTRGFHRETPEMI